MASRELHELDEFEATILLQLQLLHPERVTVAELERMARTWKPDETPDCITVALDSLSDDGLIRFVGDEIALTRATVRHSALVPSVV